MESIAGCDEIDQCPQWALCQGAAWFRQGASVAVSQLSPVHPSADEHTASVSPNEQVSPASVQLTSSIPNPPVAHATQ